MEEARNQSDKAFILSLIYDLPSALLQPCGHKIASQSEVDKSRQDPVEAKVETTKVWFSREGTCQIFWRCWRHPFRYFTTSQEAAGRVVLLRPCLSPTGPVGPIGSDPKSGGQAHGNGCEGFGEVIDQPWRRRQVPSIYQTKDPEFIPEQATIRKSSTEELSRRLSRSRSRDRVGGPADGQRSGGWSDVRISRED